MCGLSRRSGAIRQPTDHAPTRRFDDNPEGPFFLGGLEGLLDIFQPEGSVVPFPGGGALAADGVVDVQDRAPAVGKIQRLDQRVALQLRRVDLPEVVSVVGVGRSEGR